MISTSVSGGVVLTFMKYVTHRRIVQDHNLAQVRLYLSKIFDVCTIPVCAMLPVVPSGEVFTLSFEPIDDWICVFLDTSRESDQVVPFRNFAQEFVAARSFVDVVQDGYTRADLYAGRADRSAESYFYHVAGGHSIAFGHAVNQCFVQIDDESLLRRR